MRVFLVLFFLVTVTCWAQAASGQPSAPLVNTVSSPLPEAEPRLQTDSVIQLLEAEPSVRQVQQWALSEVGLARRWERDMIRDARARG
ncbi:MAG: hypothetical protein CL928_19570, partial [Deltaproteobacteria bacterium]|nr:hypothetical protein [Deltaproteobacteria bacterium]